MLVPQSVEKRWGLEKNEKLILVPLKTWRIVEVIKQIAFCAFCVLTAGLAIYFDPCFSDQIYYGLIHHRKLVKIKKDPFGLISHMNFAKFKQTLTDLGWSENIHALSYLVTKQRAHKLDCDQRIKKMLKVFFLSIRQKQIIEPKNLRELDCPDLASQTKSLNGINFSFATSPGIKTVMEDLVFAENCTIRIQGIEENISCFILMDGHGIQKGQEPINLYAKKFFLHHLRTYLNAYLKDGFNFSAVYEAFKSSFHEIHENFPHQRSGTTFCGIFFINNVLFCVSVGDSKAFLIDPFLQVPIALTADPNHPYFKEKLEKLKARVLTHETVTRVEGVLNMASAIGDRHITNQEGKRVIKPSMSFVAIPNLWIQTPAYVIMGSDGVFDHIDTSNLEEIIRQDSPLKQKSEDLVKTAFHFGSKDNLSSIVIKL